MTLIICGLEKVEQVIAERRPSHMITLLDPWSMIETPAGLAPEHHLRIGMNDIAEPVDGMVLPDEDAVSSILAFGRSWDEAAPMLIHCWAGVSRSTASAFALACERSPDVDETTIAMAMRRAAPHAYPNRRIVALADDLLVRNGRMVDAIGAMGEADFSRLCFPFDLAARHR